MSNGNHSKATAGDRSLDLALRRLADLRAPTKEEDDRFIQKLTQRIGKEPKLAGAEALLQAPFPDEVQDDAPFGGAPGDNLGQHSTPGLSAGGDDVAAAAADHHDEGAWEGTMADDQTTPANDEDQAGAEPPRPSGGLGGLAALTRSGPNPAAPANLEGEAKGDDSGRIDLRALMAPPETPAEADSGKINMAAATAPRKEAPASAAAVSSTGAAVASASAKSAAPAAKKSNNVIFLAVGGLAAAAAVVFFVSTRNKGNESTASNSGNKAAATAPAKMADKNEPAASAATPQSAATNPGDPAPAATANDPAGTVAAAPTGGPGPGAKAPLGGGTPAAGGTAAATGTNGKAAAPEKTAPATDNKGKPAPTVDPIHKPAGGDLDAVLGIGKDGSGGTGTKKTDDSPTSNLPDKPDGADIRSAINGKVGAASACVKGLDGPSSVSVSFSPAGTVAGVVVTSGPAKGTGAEACIKAAFMKAQKVAASKKGGTGFATLNP